MNDDGLMVRTRELANVLVNTMAIYFSMCTALMKNIVVGRYEQHFMFQSERYWAVKVEF